MVGRAPDPADRLLHERDGRRCDAELADAEGDEESGGALVGRELAADGDQRVRPSAALQTAEMSWRTAGSRGSPIAATAALPRSAASVYWVRSFVPMLKKSTCGAKRGCLEGGGGHLDHDADLEPGGPAAAQRARSRRRAGAAPRRSSCEAC